MGTARGDEEALNHHSGGAGAPHAGAVPGVPDRTLTVARTAQGAASLDADHHTIELTRPRARFTADSWQPLAGDPGFELFPALDNRFDPDEIHWRFDAMTDVLGLDRQRARAWTLGRVLQNSLWEIEDGRPLVPDHLEIGRRLRDTHS